MKKIYVSLVLVSLFVTTIFILQKNQNNIDNIYSDDYPNNYEMLFNSTYANRYFNEVDKKLDINLENVLLDKVLDSYFVKTKNSDKLIKEIKLSIYEDYVYSHTVGNYDIFNSMPVDDILEAVVYTLAPNTSEEEKSIIKTEFEKFDSEKSSDDFFYTFQDSGWLSIGKTDVKNEFFIMSVRNFNDKDILDHTFKYSENPKNMNKLYKSYPELEYNDIRRDKYWKKGEKQKVSGDVIKYIGSPDSMVTTAIIAKSGDPKQIYEFYFLTTSVPDILFLDGDKVEAYGILTGSSTYVNESGEESEVPLLEGIAIKLIEN